MENTEYFMNCHKDIIVQKTRNPIRLADTLSGKRYISNEIYQNIKSKTTSQKQMREIYSSLNNEKHFKHVYEWLKKHEADLLKELVQDNDEVDEPPKKKSRLENQDERDNNLSDLREISSYAKLEHWISQPQTTQKLISELERKIGEKAVEDLRKELRDKESRKSLCFKANQIDEIRRKRELESFFGATTQATFPKLAINMFFKKRGSVSLANESSAACDDSIDFTDFDSSESLFTSSFNDSSSLHNVEILSQNLSHTSDRSMNEQKYKVNNECQPQKSSGPMCADESLRDDEPQKLDVPSGPLSTDESQNEQISTKESPLVEACGIVNMQDSHTGERNDDPQRSNVPCVSNFEDVSEAISMNYTPQDEGFASADTRDVQSHEEPHRADVPTKEDVFLHQNDQKEITLADGKDSTDMKKPHSDKKYEEPRGSDVPMIQKESTKKEMLVEDLFGSTDEEEMHIDKVDDEPQPQRSDVLMVVNLDQHETITSNETPQRDGPEDINRQDLHYEEMDFGSERLNVIKHEDVSLNKNGQIIRNETPPEDRFMDQKKLYTNKIHEEPPRTDVPMQEDVSLLQKETIIKKEKERLEEEKTSADGTGNRDIKESFTHTLYQEPQRSDDPMFQKETITKNVIPVEDGFRTMDQKKAIIKNETRVEDRSGTMNQKELYTSEIYEEPQSTDVSMQEDGPGSTYMKEPYTDKKYEEPQTPDVPMQEDGPGSTYMKEPYTDNKYEEPQSADVSMQEDGHGSTYMKEPYTDKKYEEPQTPDVLMHQNETIAQKLTPLADKCGIMKTQNPHTQERKEQHQRSHEDVSLHKTDQIIRNKTAQEDRSGTMDQKKPYTNKIYEEPQRSDVGIGSTYIKEPYTDKKYEEPQRSDVPMQEDGPGSTYMKEPYTDKKYEEPQRSDVPMHQNETIAQKLTPLADKCGGIKMLDSHTGERNDEPQRSDVPMHQNARQRSHEDVSVHQNETITRQESPQEHRLGKQEAHREKVDGEPQRSKVPEPISHMVPASAHGNIGMLVSAEEHMQVNPHQMQMSSPRTTSESIQKLDNISEVYGATMAAPKTRKKRNYSKNLKVEKKKEKETWLRDWALSQCHGREEELKDILDQISIIDVAEHPEYPCFVAEDVMVYKYLTPDSQILFVAKDNTSINTKTMVQYHMFVCNIKKAIVLGPKSPKVQELQYEASKVPLEKCKNLIFKAFAPALAVYKHIQKEKHFLSLI